MKISIVAYCLMLAVPALASPPASFQVPLASTAVPNSIVFSGTSATATCSSPAVAGCGFTNGQAANITLINATGSPNCNGIYADGGTLTVIGNTVAWNLTSGYSCTSTMAGGNFAQINQAAISFNNAGTPSSGVAMISDYDSSPTFMLYSGSSGKSSMHLDFSGNAALYNLVSGQVLGLDNSGKTCVSGLALNNCQTQFNNVAGGGALSKYQGLSLGGNGTVGVVYDNSAPLTSSFGPYTIYTTPSSSYGSQSGYLVLLYVVGTAAHAGATCQLTVTYTDNATNVVTTQSSAPTSIATTGAAVSGTFYIRPAPNTAIQVTSTVSGASAYNYTLSVSAEIH